MDRATARADDRVAGEVRPPGLPAGLRPLLAAVSGVSALIVLGLGLHVAGETAPGPYDRWADAAVSALIPSPEGTPFDLIAAAGDPIPATVLALLLAGLCWRLGHRALAWTTLAGVALTGITTSALKPLNGRTINGDNLCFPSGHTAALTVFGIVLGLLAVRRYGISRGWVGLLVVLACAGTTATTIALLLIRDVVHYATDTIGGFFTALAVVAPLALVFDRRTGGGPTRRRLCPADAYPEPLLAVAGHRLPGARPAFPDRPLDGPAWTELVAGAERNRLTGLLLAAITDGALPTTPEQRRQVTTIHRANQIRVLALEQQMITIVGRLAAEGIDSRTLKGSAVAHLDYPEPGLRSFIDMDLLVRADDVDRTVATLTAAGFTRTLAEPRPGFDRRFDKGLTMITPTGFELDLHRTFVLGPWGMRVDPAGLWDEGEGYAVGGHRLDALSRPNRFMHACYHAALGDWPLRLGSLRDIAEIVARLGPDTDRVRRLAESWGVEAVVAAAVADTDRLLGTEVDPELSRWAADHRPSERELRWLALHTHADKTFAAQAIATLRELPGWRDKLAYTRALVHPDAAYTADRHSSALARFGYALRQIRKGRGRA
jgi:membrane-associated phospholipid phosphatase